MKTHSKTAALILLCTVLAFSACDSSGGNDPGNPAVHYTVAFDSQGGTAVSAQTVAENAYAAEPAAPSRAERKSGV